MHVPYIMPGSFPEKRPHEPELVAPTVLPAELLSELPFADVFDAPHTHASFSNASYGNDGHELGMCQHGHDAMRPMHTPLPLTRDEIRTCMAVAAEISGMPILNEPKFCMPITGDFTISAAQDRHYAASSLSFDRREQNKTGLTQFATTVGLAGAAAVYLPSGNTILFEPGVSSLIKSFGDTWPLKSVLVHEMTHAAQKQNFPDVFVSLRTMRLESVKILNRPTNTFSDLLQMRQDLIEVGKQGICIKLLIEGHASWVQTRAGERVFKASTKPLHRLGYHAWSLNTKIGSFWPLPDVYAAGRNMIDAVEALQQELEMAPFADASGRAVTLDPKLRNHGLVRLVFENPEMVRSLLPNFESGWRRSVRERADVRSMRQFVMSLPGHVPLSAPELEAI